MSGVANFYVKGELARAAQRACTARQIVAKQELRIATMKAAGHSTARSERILELLIKSLNLIEDYERELRSTAAGLQKLDG